MKSRTTLILVLVALFIGGLVTLDYYRGTTTDQARANSRKLLDLKADDVVSIDLVRTNQEIVLEKTGDRWDIQKPLAVRADVAAVHSLLDALEFAERQRTLTARDLAGAKTAEFGLTDPAIKITLTPRRGGAVTLKVGRETPTKDAVYVQRAGQKEIAIVRRSLRDSLDRKLDDLRDRTVVQVVPSAATRLEIKSADRVIELARTGPPSGSETRWTIVRPLAVNADQQRIQQLLEDLGGLRAMDFVSEDSRDLHPYRLDEPAREITVTTGALSQILLIGSSPTNDPSKVYAKLKGANSIFTVAADQARRFAVQVNDLRDPRVLTFADDAVESIELVHGTEKFLVNRDGARWKLSLASGGSVPADQGRVDDLLVTLQNLRARQFTADVATDLDKYGLASPAVAVTLLGRGTNLIAQLLVGSADSTNGLRFAKRADLPFIYGVDTNLVDQIPTGPLALRTRRLAEIKPDQISRLTLRTGAGQTTVNRAADGKWQLVDPPQGVLDVEKLQRALAAMAGLRAEEFLADRLPSAARYGLDQPALTVTATVGERSYILTLGKTADAEHQYATWNDPPLVFTVLTADTRDLDRQIVTPPTPTATATNQPAVATAPSR